MKKNFIWVSLIGFLAFTISVTFAYDFMLWSQTILVGSPLFLTVYEFEEVLDRVYFGISLVGCLLIAFALSRIHSYLYKRAKTPFVLYSVSTFVFWVVGIFARTLMIIAVEIPSLEESAQTFGAENIGMSIRGAGYPEWAFASALMFGYIAVLAMIIIKIARWIKENVMHQNTSSNK